MTWQRGPEHTLTRMFDDGAGLVLRGSPREDGVTEGLALSVSFCMNPACACRDVSVVARHLEWPADGTGLRRGGRLHAKLDLDSGAVSAAPTAAPDSQDDGLIELVRTLLSGGPLELLRERWKRVKRLGDPDEWRHVDWGRIEIEWLVPYCEIFPSRWDLSVVTDDERYWVVDAWCLRPKCPCTELSVEFVAENGGSVGVLRVDARSGRVIEPTGETAAHRLWKGFMAEPNTRRILAERRKDVRRVARQLPAVLAPAPGPTTAIRVGRNDPCPCGSGKKHKRCCGG